MFESSDDDEDDDDGGRWVAMMEFFGLPFVLPRLVHSEPRVTSPKEPQYICQSKRGCVLS